MAERTRAFGDGPYEQLGTVKTKRDTSPLRLSCGTRAFPVSPIAGNIRGSRPGTGVSSVVLSEADSGRVRNREFAPVLRVQ